MPGCTGRWRRPSPRVSRAKCSASGRPPTGRAAPPRLAVRSAPGGTYLPEPSDPGPVPRAIYIGDVRRSRGLPVMLAAVEAAPGWELDVVGPVAAADQAWLDDWIATSPAASRVRFHGRKPPSQAWALALGAWVGLSPLDDTPAFPDAVPTKLYEYLAAGLAVA